MAANSTSRPTLPVLIFGGTFDPPHRAHIELPFRAAEALGCHTVIFVPTSLNPLKTGRPTTAGHRLAMLRLALRDHPEAVIDTTELENPGASYTVDTLERLAALLKPGGPGDFRLLLGSDAAASFYRWKEPHRILALAIPAVMLRPPDTPETFGETMLEATGGDAAATACWTRWIIDLPEIEATATGLRATLARGAADTLAGDLLDPAVLAYARRHHLYGCRAAT